MIRLTRLNSQPVVVNSDLIKFIEEAPDTLITLVNGEKFMVQESGQDVVKLIVDFRRAVLKSSSQPTDYLLSARPQAALTMGGESSMKNQSER